MSIPQRRRVLRRRVSERVNCERQIDRLLVTCCTAVAPTTLTSCDRRELLGSSPEKGVYHLQECTPSGNYDLSRSRHETTVDCGRGGRRNPCYPSVRRRCVKYVACPLERTTPGGGGGGGAKRARGKEFNSRRDITPVPASRSSERRSPDDVRGTDCPPVQYHRLTDVCPSTTNQLHPPHSPYTLAATTLSVRSS